MLLLDVKTAHHIANSKPLANLFPEDSVECAAEFARG